MINFKRNEKKRIFCINVYLCVPPGNAKIRHKIKYNKSKYKLYIIEISNASDIAFIQEKGYDKTLDMLYILSNANIKKYFKNKPSLLNNSTLFYSIESCFETLNTSLK